MQAGRRATGRLIASAAIALAAFAQATRASAQSADIFMNRAPNRQELLVEGAKREGQVVFYCSMIVNQAIRPIADAFMKKYPFVKLTFWRNDAEEIIAKVSAEARANNLLVDVIESSGVGVLAEQAGFLQPYFTPLMADYPEAYRDARGAWAPTRLSYFGTAYNTRLVARDQAPKTYEDLLDPRWKGKMAWRISTASGTPLFLANLRLAWGEAKAAAYFDRLKEQQIVNFGAGSARTLVDRVIAGEYSLALNIYAHHPLISKARGAPVDTALHDPVPATSAEVIVAKGARHPHAAMLLIDFILSREGQEIMAKAEYYPARPDIPPLDHVASVVPAKAGVPENFIAPEKLYAYVESSEAIWREKFR